MLSSRLIKKNVSLKTVQELFPLSLYLDRVEDFDQDEGMECDQAFAQDRHQLLKGDYSEEAQFKVEQVNFASQSTK